MSIILDLEHLRFPIFPKANMANTMTWRTFESHGVDDLWWLRAFLKPSMSRVTPRLEDVAWAVFFLLLPLVDCYLQFGVDLGWFLAIGYVGVVSMAHLSRSTRKSQQNICGLSSFLKPFWQSYCHRHRFRGVTRASFNCFLLKLNLAVVLWNHLRDMP